MIGTSVIAVREALPDEWKQVANVTQIANAQYASEADKDWWREYENSTRALVETEPSLLRIVATRGDETVGSVIYMPPYERMMGGKLVQNPYPEMRLLSVLPTARNEGVANALITACEQESRTRGAAAMTLHTTGLMAVAQSMYLRRGYVRYPEIDFEPVPGFVVLGYIKYWNSEVE